jgi:hypothetical protein
MQRRFLLVGVGLALVLGLGLWSWRATATKSQPVTENLRAKKVPAKSGPISEGTNSLARSSSGMNRPSEVELTAAEKAARIEKIKRDYDEITTKVAAEFSAAGNDFPGGLNAYLRQLALLEREKWKDIAGLLSPRELEDLQMIDTRAGKEVQRLLSDAAVSDEQRRAVFRLQREFDDKYALVFDTATPALLARETERQALQEKILGVLGPDAFSAWLRGEGSNFDAFANFAAQHQLSPQTAIEVWRARNEFIRQNLANEIQPAESAAQRMERRRGLTEVMRQRVGALVGPNAIDDAPEAFGWLPQVK